MCYVSGLMEIRWFRFVHLKTSKIVVFKWRFTLRLLLSMFSGVLTLGKCESLPVLRHKHFLKQMKNTFCLLHVIVLLMTRKTNWVGVHLTIEKDRKL